MIAALPHLNGVWSRYDQWAFIAFESGKEAENGFRWEKIRAHIFFSPRKKGSKQSLRGSVFPFMYAS